MGIPLDNALGVVPPSFQQDFMPVTTDTLPDIYNGVQSRSRMLDVSSGTFYTSLARFWLDIRPGVTNYSVNICSAKIEPGWRKEQE